ncbi:DEAD/DEAH box helicase [Microlunatus sp. Gsoil 973]|uniref:DEAD/DEAH box helicase n=1 Tax=Microlunatus sp. Gsoil 973 TaxID=2672569 RepID=UPI0012B4BE3F|nr:DEAD/DEAH box helicase [Microlunatus sp. Gsoil 973]
MSDGQGLLDSEQVRHRRRLPERVARYADWPSWLPVEVVDAVRSRGIERPWQHQVQVADAAYAGCPVAVTTGTASGKTLGYLLPVMAATYGGAAATAPVPLTARTQTRSLLRPKRPHTALYLAPTKALAHDQLRAAGEFGLPGWRVAAVDGDSDTAERDWARDHAGYVLTNPDFLHYSVLPNHGRWAGFLGNLRYVVIDEAHRYRGVFGSHVAQVVRRLRRLCASYGANPVFILASATVTGADRMTAELVGCEADRVTVVDQDASPHGAVDFTLWEPMQYPTDEAAHLMARFVDAGLQTVTFIASRRMAELTAVRAQEQVGVGGDGPPRIDSYRAGYLASDRRALEAGLQDGSLRGLAATNALELGVDVAGLDAVIITGFPGTRSALWQQAGRAGRTGRDAEVVLIAARNPLDAYYFDHPELLFDEPIEQTVLHAANPYVLGPHLAAAAQELPITEADACWFGPQMIPVLHRLESQGVLRRRPAGWFWPRPERAGDAVDLRGAGGPVIEIVEIDSGRVLGTVDQAGSDGTVHPGAVYLHQGDSYLVEELDQEECEALVSAARPGYYTEPRGTHDVQIVEELQHRPFGNGVLHYGEVDVFSQVVGYLRRDEVTSDVWDETPLDMPERRLRTKATWWTFDGSGLDLSATQLGSAAHAAEHTAIGLLPMFAPCDRWDIGGLSTILHPDTGTLTVFVHDGHPGGAGFAERGYQVAEAWWAATLERLNSCRCELGCPSCVVSPKCGNANQMLDKQAAIWLLEALLRDPAPTDVGSFSQPQV